MQQTNGNEQANLDTLVYVASGGQVGSYEAPMNNTNQLQVPLMTRTIVDIPGLGPDASLYVTCLAGDPNPNSANLILRNQTTVNTYPLTLLLNETGPQWNVNTVGPAPLDIPVNYTQNVQERASAATVVTKRAVVLPVLVEAGNTDIQGTSTAVVTLPPLPWSEFDDTGLIKVAPSKGLYRTSTVGKTGFILANTYGDIGLKNIQAPLVSTGVDFLTEGSWTHDFAESSFVEVVIDWPRADGSGVPSLYTGSVEVTFTVDATIGYTGNPPAAPAIIGITTYWLRCNTQGVPQVQTRDQFFTTQSPEGVATFFDERQITFRFENPSFGRGINSSILIGISGTYYAPPQSLSGGSAELFAKVVYENMQNENTHNRGLVKITNYEGATRIDLAETYSMSPVNEDLTLFTARGLMKYPMGPEAAYQARRQMMMALNSLGVPFAGSIEASIVEANTNSYDKMLSILSGGTSYYDTEITPPNVSLSMMVDESDRLIPFEASTKSGLKKFLRRAGKLLMPALKTGGKMLLTRGLDEASKRYGINRQSLRDASKQILGFEAYTRGYNPYSASTRGYSARSESGFDPVDIDGDYVAARGLNSCDYRAARIRACKPRGSASVDGREDHLRHIPLGLYRTSSLGDAGFLDGDFIAPRGLTSSDYKAARIRACKPRGSSSVDGKEEHLRHVPKKKNPSNHRLVDIPNEVITVHLDKRLGSVLPIVLRINSLPEGETELKYEIKSLLGATLHEGLITAVNGALQIDDLKLTTLKYPEEQDSGFLKVGAWNPSELILLHVSLPRGNGVNQVLKVLGLNQARGSSGKRSIDFKASTSGGPDFVARHVGLNVRQPQQASRKMKTSSQVLPSLNPDFVATAKLVSGNYRASTGVSDIDRALKALEEGKSGGGGDGESDDDDEDEPSEADILGDWEDEEEEVDIRKVANDEHTFRKKTFEIASRGVNIPELDALIYPNLAATSATVKPDPDTGNKLEKLMSKKHIMGNPIKMSASRFAAVNEEKQLSNIFQIVLTLAPVDTIVYANNGEQNFTASFPFSKSQKKSGLFYVFVDDRFTKPEEPAKFAYDFYNWAGVFPKSIDGSYALFINLPEAEQSYTISDDSYKGALFMALMGAPYGPFYAFTVDFETTSQGMTVPLSSPVKLITAKMSAACEIQDGKFVSCSDLFLFNGTTANEAGQEFIATERLKAFDGKAPRALMCEGIISTIQSVISFYRGVYSPALITGDMRKSRNAAKVLINQFQLRVSLVDAWNKFQSMSEEDKKAPEGRALLVKVRGFRDAMTAMRQNLETVVPIEVGDEAPNFSLVPMHYKSIIPSSKVKIEVVQGQDLTPLNITAGATVIPDFKEGEEYKVYKNLVEDGDAYVDGPAQRKLRQRLYKWLISQGYPNTIQVFTSSGERRVARAKKNVAPSTNFQLSEEKYKGSYIGYLVRTSAKAQKQGAPRAYRVFQFFPKIGAKPKVNTKQTKKTKRDKFKEFGGIDLTRI